jgi:beta-lactam-binding protein with PASTA domain
VRISTVYGGTWPAQIWRAFMSAATARMEPKDFPTGPELDFVTLRVDVTQGCLANPYTPPQDIDTFQYPEGSESASLLEVCTKPTSYQELTVPSVIGMKRQAAISALHAAGFNVAVHYAAAPREPDDTVIDQDPSAGSRLIQTGTVTITVARSGSGGEGTRVPDVIGMPEGAAVAALRNEGFEITVVRERECAPSEPGCDYRKGVVWAQSPAGGADAPAGSTVTIVVNP